MSLTPGTRLGSYEIIAPLGAGGMGEVYRAKDTNLNRDVALKTLPESFALDVDRVARFKREAQVLASLNHPNIAVIYGIEGHAIVMELIEGDDLSTLIARGPLALADVAAIGKQIADALETAHEAGVVHRDLKPANIKVRADGSVKVLDFGLARTMEFGSSSSDLANSPTLTAHATQLGVILGTAAYMSPEQAKGKAADRRADVWAFGVVLFEMITGQQLFQGDSAPEVMASVMKEEPDWSRLPANLPVPMRRLLRRCLEKDPKKRLSSMNDARLELGEPEGAPAEMPVARKSSRVWLAATALISVTLTALVFLFVVPALRPARVIEPTRVSVVAPPGVNLLFDAAESSISPDGRAIVMTGADASGSTKLWVRPLNALTAHPLAGTDGGKVPFWSPDSTQIGFFTLDGKLKKIPVAGGTVEILCDAPDGRGGTWAKGDVIVFSPSSAGALLQVSANGGDTKPATTLVGAETGHRFPWFLPDGRHFLFVALPQKSQRYDLFVGSLDGGAPKLIGTPESAAVYAEPGYLLFARKNTLLAQAFDARTLNVSGEPTSIGDAPAATGGLYVGGRPVSVSSTGVLEYLGDRLPDTTLQWFDRSGRPGGTLAAPAGRYQGVEFAPNGRRVALARFESQSSSDLWIVDIERGDSTRFTSALGANYNPIWSFDGSQILFAADRKASRDLWIKPSSGATEEVPFFESAAMFKDPRSWSRDGKTIIFDQLDARTNNDIWMISTGGERVPQPYLRTSFNESFGALSPDGRWLAYVSDESGRNEVYVDSFPIPRGRRRVTDTGAVFVWWRTDGRELGMISADRRTFLVADVTPGAEFKAGPARPLVVFPKATVYVSPTPDFQRLLASVPVNDNAFSSVTLVMDWAGALKRR